MSKLKLLLPIALVGTFLLPGTAAHAENKTDSSSTPIEAKKSDSQSLDGGAAKTEEKATTKEEAPKTALDKKEPDKKKTEEKLPQAGAEDGVLGAAALAAAVTGTYLVSKRKKAMQ